MNASRAKRRWLRWCRYVQKTQSRANAHSKWNAAGTHHGQAWAYSDAMYANRYYPKGVREPWYPRWGTVR